MPGHYRSFPPDAYYGGAPNAFAGGMLFSQDLRQRRAQENALRALIAEHGPRAGDPTAWGQVEGITQRRELHPFAVSDAERTDEARRAMVEQYGPPAGDPVAWGQMEGITQRRDLHPYAVSGAERADQAMGAAVEQMGPIAGSPQAYEMQQQQQEVQRDVLHRGITALRMVRDRGGDLDAAFQQYAPILERLGMPPERLMALREQILTNPDSLDELDAMLRDRGGAGSGSDRLLGQGMAFEDEAGNVRFMQFSASGQPQEPLPGWKPISVEQAQQRIDQRTRAQDFAETEAVMPSREPGVVRRQDPYTGEVWSEITPGSPAAFNRMQKIEEMQEGSRDAIYTIQFRIDQSGTVLSLGERSMPVIQEREKYGVLRAATRLAQSKVPGTDMYRLQDYFDDIKANIGIDELIAIKRDGAGLGHIPMTQLQSLQRMLTDLHVGRDFKDLEKDLSNIIRIYKRLVDGGTADIQRIEQRMEWLQEEWGNVSGRPRSQQQQQPGAAQQGAAQQGAAQQGAAQQQGGGWQARADELMAQGLSDDEISAILRREGLIR